MTHPLVPMALFLVMAGCDGGRVQRRVEPEPIPDPRCGDGNLNEGEECDGAELADQSCSGLGFDYGSLSCGEDCRFVTSACVKLCGNGTLDVGEECDGALGPLSCAGWGFKRCSAQCKVEARTCGATPFVALDPLPLAEGGPTLVTDLSPKGYGELVTAVPSFSRLAGHRYHVTWGFQANQVLITNQVSRPLAAAAGDLDGDGRMDLASINDDGTIDRYVFNGNGYPAERLRGSGSPITCAPGPWVAAGPIDSAPGAELVALGCPAAGPPTTYGGVMVFSSAAGSTPRFIDVAGITAATAARRGEVLDVLLATDAGKLVILRAPELTAEAPVELGLVAAALAAGDLDGDGDLDLAVVTAGEVQVLENTGQGFTARRTFTAAAEHLRIADLDLDGLPDLAWAEPGQVQVLRNLGAFTFTQTPLTTGAGAVLSFDHGDFEGDGDPDLAITVQQTGTAVTVHLFRNEVF
jgi:hypothetical protein